MSAGAGAIIGGAQIGGQIYGAKKQADAARDAAGMSLQGSREAIAEQRRQYDLSRQDMEPWREAGGEALGSLRALARGDFSGFTASPGYQFRLDEGQKAIERSAAARGGLQSGRTLKDLMRFGQGQASAEFGDYYNRLAGMAGVGQTTNQSLATLGAQAAGNIGNIGMTNAANMGNAALAAGNARGSMYQGIGNTLGQLGAYGAQNNWFGGPSAGAAAGGGGYYTGFGNEINYPGGVAYP